MVEGGNLTDPDVLQTMVNCQGDVPPLIYTDNFFPFNYLLWL